MRPPEWIPDPDLKAATKAALEWWSERKPHRRRPANQSEWQEIVAYAWTFRDCTPAQVRYVATNVMARSKGHWPDHAEVEEEIRDGRRRREELSREAKPQRERWTGREDDPCPHCAALPVYSIGEGRHADHWRYTLPCQCDDHGASASPSLWLRGIPARPEDDPIKLAALHKSLAEKVVNEWRKTGKRMADVLADMVQAMEAPRRAPDIQIVPKRADDAAKEAA